MPASSAARTIFSGSTVRTCSLLSYTPYPNVAQPRSRSLYAPSPSRAGRCRPAASGSTAMSAGNGAIASSGCAGWFGARSMLMLGGREDEDMAGSRRDIAGCAVRGPRYRTS